MQNAGMYSKALRDADLFEDAGHRSRFEELLKCYEGFPFLTAGLIKCMYMSAMDDEHFLVMLETLSEMTTSRERNTEEMMMRGDAKAYEAGESEEATLYRFSMALLDGQDLDSIEGMDHLSPLKQHQIDMVKQAAMIIDRLKV